MTTASPTSARLSVIVTTYNIESYVEQCLQSIVDQTLTELEIIVVDDGSSDRTPEIIERFAAADPRIVPVLLAENSVGGVATAANAGLDRATAPYVGFADGDDFYELTMFERLLDAAMRHDADLAMCQYRLFDDTNASTTDPADANRWKAVDRDHYELDTATRKQFLRFVSVPWRKIYRRSMLDDHGLRFPVGDYFYEDNPFHWFTLLSAKSMAIVPEPLCHHRVARIGQTMATADARLFRIFEHHDTIRDWLRENGLLDEYGPALLAWAMSQMEWIAPRTPHDLRRDLLQRVQRVFELYDETTIERALVEGGKGQTTRSLTTAVRAGNLAAFNRALDGDPASTNPLVAAVYHLRYSGLKHTLRLTLRFVRNKLERTSLPGLGRNTATRSITNQDLMFSLTVLERRLESIEERLDVLAEQLDADR